MSRIEILTIGDELVEGRLVDTNAGEMSAVLADAGLRVARHASVGDEIGEIVAALRAAASRADAVLVSGGLGPTSDDLTAAAAAAAFGLAVERSAEAFEHTRRFFVERGREMAPTNAKQADLPAGSTILPNPVGTAVGFRLDTGACRLYFMPGVPHELRRMVADQVLPDLTGRLAAAPPLVATLKIFGLGESDVAHRLEGIERGVPEEVRLTVQYRATFPEIHVRLVLAGDRCGATPEVLEALAGEARRRLGRHVFAVGGAVLDAGFPDRVAAELAERGLTMAAAEVASSGRLAQLLGLTADGRRCLAGGLVAPDPEALATQLGTVSADPGELAETVRRRLDAGIGVAALGAAGGPGGPPPGRLVVAAAGRGRELRRELHFPLDPDRFQLLAAYAALRLAFELATDEG
ncbi:MAG: molybdopterin-binding protein [Thermoanaerobaculales bacterium]|jgi:nicotinamide-nucleotide amidase|nr:molybdopterin-binding protein [Thermoanaerobaculales bacterium]